MTINILKICSVAALIVVAFIALGPANWTPRSGLGWEFDHFVGYFVLALLFCFAWPRPLLVGSVLVTFAALVELLQIIPADRSSNILAAFYSALGVGAAALMAELFSRAQRRRFQSSKWADGRS
jgi:predicted cation transporter